jgi:hypothetical protein
LRISRSWIVSLALAAIFPAAARAQSYGGATQLSTIDATAFHGESHQPVFHSDGYLYNANPDDANGSTYDAPVRLPDGAQIEEICFFLRNQEPDQTGVHDVALLVEKFSPQGLPPQEHVIMSASPTTPYGYLGICRDKLGYPFNDEMDVDFDGVSDHVSYRAIVTIHQGATLGLGGVQIRWRRRVSAAPAQATFPDVPAGSLFFQYVEALAASGITGGCGGGNYCPDASLTRGQMAVFLAKALGLHWVE